MKGNETNKGTSEPTNKQPSVQFNDCKTCGDTIQALVEYFGGQILGEFTLRSALEQVKELDAKLKETKADFLASRKVSAKVGGAQ